MKTIALTGLSLALFASAVQGQNTQPLVAIHDSELTRALETMPAVDPTPSGPGTTSNQWWTTDWHYFVMPEALKESLRSDGTAFTVIGDSNITAGVLLTNGRPKYPIMISLASEAVRNDEIGPLTNYVAAGGFLFVGSSAFTRNPDGTTRGDFAIGNQMGLHMTVPGLVNWTVSTYFAKTNQTNHRLVSHLPNGDLLWRMPASADEITEGAYPTHVEIAAHDVWQVTPSGATVLALGDDTYPYLAVQPYGKGYFIYYAPFQPLIGHGGYAPGMNAYAIFRHAIEWAFESANVPVAKLSAWPYPYDAALTVRHDLENFTNLMADIDSSARVEYTNGVRADYYFCTGTLREDASPGGFNTNTMIANMRHAVTNYGATIEPHNGGLKNPNADANLLRGDYDWFHWGTDEALDVTPPGYPSGKVYAFTSQSNAFRDVEGWLPGLMTSTTRVCAAPYYNSCREDSYDILNSLSVRSAGEQKDGPFPHWTVSTRTSGKRYGFVSLPVSDWYVQTNSPTPHLAQSMEDLYDPDSLHTCIDFYYNLGALINVYGHTLSDGVGPSWGAGSLETEYLTYSMNAGLHPRLWSTNALGVYQWWLQRSNAQVSVSYRTNGNQSIASFTISGSLNTNTTVELVVPATMGYCSLQVVTNGALALGDVYRTNGQSIKLRVGTTITSATISYYPLSPGAVVFSENFDGVSVPALPSGWTTSASSGVSAWVNQTANADTLPNAASSADSTVAGTNQLVSPTISMPADRAQLSFMNNYDFEKVGGVAYDGGVLEIKIGSGAFTDILAAGGSFVSGGYTDTITSGSGNPLAGRQAWSGSSGDFIPTVVNLPVTAENQNIQLRWRCATDTGNNGTFGGWQIDTVAITHNGCLCCNPNHAPVLTATPANRTIAEATLLTVTNAATDADLDVLSYNLTTGPTNATIDANGIITWTPTEAQGPSTNTITTVVTDNGVPPMSATNSFTVTVTEVNSAPVLPVQANRVITSATTLTITNTATDTDIPANTLTYVLTNAPLGAAISANGVITWTPTLGMEGTSNTFTTVVKDNGSPPLSATNSFSVFINMKAAVVDSTVLVAEGCVPTNNAIDPGETVTVSFALKNTGLGNTANLVATLLATNGIVGPSAPQNYGVLVPGGAAVSRPFSFTANGSCASNIIATLQLQDGALNLGTASATFTLGQTSIIFTQSFDGVTAPALPAGWVNSNTASLWITTNSLADTAPNAAYTPDATTPGVNSLVSPVFALPAGRTQLTFRNNYDLELENSNTGYDGGVLDIKIGTNAFTDIITAGGTFVSGGYNVTIDARYNNPLSNRPAWSGNSGGYITTTVTLPAAASGTTNQLRWRCGTDNAVGMSGWRIDSVAISGWACCANSAPTLPGQSNRTIAELSLLSVTNTATDPGVPANPLTYLLINSPTNATISTNGIIAWTPNEAQGPATNVGITTVVMNSGVPSLTATNTFLVTVTEVNSAPALPGQLDRTIAELSAMTVTNTATDTDIPANTLTYSLLAAPTNALIDANGVITWTPTEAQGPGSFAFTTRVVDNGSPALSATNTFNVTVTEVNSAPVLPGQADRTIAEMSNLTVVNTATDTDIPANALSYSLLTGPTNAAIDASGIITWTPTESQGPGSFIFTTRVVDNGVPPLSATNSFTMVVTEVNSAPVLPSQPDQTIAELSTLTVTNTATDTDVPANILSYSLLTGPTNAVINASGIITWTPNEAQGPSTNTITTRVVDNGTPPLSATNTFTVVVTEVNSAPMLPAQADLTIAELSSMTVSNTATDTDIPANTLAYSLLAGPTNAVIDANGVITWTPTEAQGPGSFTFTTRVVDDGVPALSATNSFNVTVTEVNSAPVLPAQADLTIAELSAMTVTNTATDTDVPANTLTYSLLAGPGNAAIDATGVITWTPTEAQGPGNFTFTTRVVDDGSPTLSATNSFNVTVTEVNSAPVLPTQSDLTIAELSTLTISNTATDTDIPANTLTYSLLAGPTNAVIDASGVITWTPTKAQGPGSFTFTTRVVDNGVPPLSATNSFNVTVTEVNSAPVLPAQSDRTVADLSALTVTNTASDSDIPANTLAYSLLTGPTNAVIDANGVITWTPTEAQGPGNFTFTTRVVDDGVPPLSETNSFSVTVIVLNSAPVLPAQSDLTIAELSALTITNTATDTDVPANTLTYSLLTGPTNAVIDAHGVITWTPTEAQGPGSFTFTTRVVDNGAPPLSATNHFTVTVTEVNSAPVLPPQFDLTISEMTPLTVPNTATDTDIPANTLAYILLDGPTNAVIDANGVITWTPTEAQGPGSFTFTTRVVDNGVPPLSATNSFSITVTEMNSAPVLPAQSDLTIAELTPLTVPNTATDTDIPANTLTYSLLAGPTNAVIDANGVITWTPTEAQGPGSFTFTTRVVDNGTPPLSATNTFNVTVTEVNSAPVLPAQPDKTITQLSMLTITNTATDTDIPANTLAYSLLAGPTNAVIDADGIITWTPTSGQGRSTNVLTTRVVDTGVPPLSATNSFTVVALVPVATAPVASLTVSNGIAIITWDAVSGYSYKVQYKDTLNDPAWQDLGSSVNNVGANASASDPIGNHPQRFYRIQAQ